MSVSALIAAAAQGPLTAADVERAGRQSDLSAAEILDRLAHRIADGYTSGEYEFAFCDAVVNNAIFGWATGTEDNWRALSRFAWGVFEAFDQGEFRGEEVTKSLIATVLSRGFLKLGD